MKIDAHATAITQTFKPRQVTAYNIAKQSRVNPTAAMAGDKVSISDAAKAAAEELPVADPARDIVQSRINEATVEANVDVIQTQDGMYRAPTSLNRP